MRVESFGNVTIPDFILNIPCNDAAEKQANTCVTCIEQRQALPGMLTPEKGSCCNPFYYFAASGEVVKPGQEVGSGEDHQKVTRERGNLTAGDFCYCYGKIIQIGLVGALFGIEGTCHGACRERGLLGSEG